MAECKPAITALDPGDKVLKLETADLLDAATATLYGKLLGKVGWITNWTRPDLCVAYSLLASHTAAPQTHHMTSEAETIALCQTVQMAIAARMLYADIDHQRPTDVTLAPTVVHVDNASTIFLVNNVGNVGTASKHTAVKYHYVREQILADEITVIYMPGEHLPADALTKILHRPRQHALLPLIMGDTHHSMTSAAPSHA